MNSMWMQISQHLDVVKHFMNNSLQLIDAEYGAVTNREELGEFMESDDRDNALYFPMHEEEIVLRSVYYELSSLIELNLRLIAVGIIKRRMLQRRRQLNL